MPARKPLASAVALLQAACLLGVVGCEIRDEPVRPIIRNGLAGAGAGRAVEQGVEYAGGYEDGLKRSTAEQKPLLVIFRAAWCRFSAELTQRTLVDPRLVELSRRSVCVMVDADRDAETCRSFGVNAFPTLIVLGPGGRERFRATGRPAADAVVAALEEALATARVAAGDEQVTR
jgi:thiol:disulfide interchange protein